MAATSLYRDGWIFSHVHKFHEREEFDTDSQQQLLTFDIWVTVQVVYGLCRGWRVSVVN